MFTTKLNSATKGEKSVLFAVENSMRNVERSSTEKKLF